MMNEIIDQNNIIVKDKKYSSKPSDLGCMDCAFWGQDGKVFPCNQLLCLGYYREDETDIIWLGNNTYPLKYC